MDLIQQGAQLIKEKLGIDLDAATAQSALSGLMGDGQGGLDLQGLIGKMASSGELGSLVDSWLGDSSNLPISTESIIGMFGEEKISEFANTVGVDTKVAASGLSELLPDLMDKASSGGSLLESAGGLGGLMGAAKSFLS